MIKRAFIFAMLIVMLFAVIGCEARLSTPTESGAEAKGDAYFYDEAFGKVLTNLSNRFDFKIEQWELHLDEETGKERLLFSVSIKNKTEMSIKNFNCDILFDDNTTDLFTTGIIKYDKNQPVDLIPELSANGATYAFDLLVNSDEQIKDTGADKNELMQKARNMTLMMKWDSGDETVTIDCGEIEKVKTELLAVKDFIGIDISAPEGSGSIRTLTLDYYQNGTEKTDKLIDISSIDNSDYDEEAKVQTLTDSDEDADGIVDFIVYREFWFPDLTMSHPEVPLWPTVYEYNLNKGFVIASAKHKAVFEQYANTMSDRLKSDTPDMTENAKLSLKRLIAAAKRVADGSFVPKDSYMDMNYYEDVYELTKDIKD